MSNLFASLDKADLHPYRPVVFWSWNAAIRADEVRRQISEMKSYGLGGFVLHARAGLKTEYLSEEWFDLVGLCLNEAAKQGLSVWIYDEYGWPSGFAGGRLLENRDNCARYLEYRINAFYDKDAYAVYAVSDGEIRRLNADERAQEYHTLYLRYSDSYADILNPAVTERFLSMTHEQYFKRFAPSFGKELVGFFTDEPQYYRYAAPISKATEEEYFRRYGEDVKDGLLYLFLQSEKGYPFRVRYYNLMSGLYCANFYKKLYDWCDRHGCMLTGHSVEETFFYTQMWGGADCAPSYLYEHVPAIDNLARTSPAGISAKSAGSVAAQSGRKQVMTETFGCSGYAVTPRELRLIAEKQYVHGVNSMCQHLYNYSLAGQGKIDHPISFGRTLPWIDGYKTFNDYFTQLGYLLANAEEEAPVALITPMESVYLDYIRLAEETAAKNVDEGFLHILDELRAQSVAFHFVNEKVLEHIGGVKNGTLTVGGRTYQAVVLANCRELKENTVTLLQEFLKQGGMLVTAGQRPRYVEGESRELKELSGNAAVGELPKPFAFTAEKPVDFTCRKKDGRRFVFFVNERGEEVRLSTKSMCCETDLVSGTSYAPQREFVLAPYGSLLLEEDGDGAELAFTPVRTDEIVPVFERAEENCLTLENAEVTLENGEVLSGYVHGIFETLVKRGYCGTIRAAFSFESDCERAITLTIETLKAENRTFNGVPVSFAQDDSDVNFAKARLTARRGKNVYEYCAQFDDAERINRVLFGKDVPESLRNCFTYSTLLEPVYVQGEFDTAGYALVTPKRKTAGDLTAAGLENFCGAVEYSFEIDAPSDRVRLKPIGDFAMCEFFCGEKRAIVLMHDGVQMKLDGAGRHSFRVRCYGTMRNKFGPFHCADFSEDCVSPDSFTLRGTWTDEKTNPSYSPERKLVPFGLSFIRVEYDCRSGLPTK